ncbi:hypothetical protein GCM10027429_22510 [Marivirga atlantica]|uniref:Uncharacterized protein n=1 Tax=Marivirga atlantica TaxID=1548457 RepID=A0A937AG55_9BACT|nr:hypothetical protein [Marivirga atlantica]MBL0765869.1 hypothetical protein [Marivirga atlantica]
MENKDWKNRVANYEANADASLWTSIGAKLPNGSGNWKYGVLLLLLFLGAGSTYYFNSNNSDDLKTTTEIQSLSNELNNRVNSTSQLQVAVKDNIEFDQANSNISIASAEDNMSENASHSKKKTFSSFYNSKFINSTEYAKEAIGSSFKDEPVWNTLVGRQFIPLQDSIYFNKRINTVALPKLIKEPIVKPKKQFYNAYFSFQGFSSYHKINPNLMDDHVIEYVQSDALSWDRVGFRTSFGFEKSLKDRWKLYAGLSLVRQSQKIKVGYYNAQSDSINVTQSDNGLTLATYKETIIESFKITNFSTGLQLGVKYKVLERRPLSQWIDFQLEGHYQLGDKQFYGNQMYYFNMSYNNYFRMNTKLQFRIAPVISYTFNNYNGNGEQLFSLKPYSLGIDIGLVFTF